MPSFDIVSEIDMQEVLNAVDNASPKSEPTNALSIILTYIFISVGLKNIYNID